ncbi:MAG: hypothetical protein ACI4W0_00255 [Bacilli bacterium]
MDKKWLVYEWCKGNRKLDLNEITFKEFLEGCTQYYLTEKDIQ